MPLLEHGGLFSALGSTAPSRLYESPPRYDVGQKLSAGDLAGELDLRGYRAVEKDPEALLIGEYSRSKERIAVRLRSFPLSSGWTESVVVDARFRRGWLAGLEVSGETVQSVWLDPRLLTSFYSDQLIDRWRVSLESLPDHVWRAILAAEDATFFTHGGLSARGIVRAVWTNVRDGVVDEGGSTLTQQLVKNLYVGPQRAVSRKVREAAIAVLLEIRYSKEEILEGYLNTAYMGSSGSVQLVGLGAAARTYFGVPAAELDLAQAAALAGMIKSPANLAPSVDAERCQHRRDQVLDRLAELGWITTTELDAAKSKPVVLSGSRIDRYFARFAADAAAVEASERFGAAKLSESGATLVSTLSYADQEAAESAVAWGVSALEEGWQKANDRPLQAALVSVDPQTGGVKAWIGGRDYRQTQFDRLRKAHRQVGSAFKPVVLAAALAERRVSPADRLVDEPLSVRLGGKIWRPQNDDRSFRGDVSVRESFERSLNVPTVRLALDVGLEAIVHWARRLGVESDLDPYPSMALGAFEMTPVELLTVYSTLAARGRRPDVHLLEAVFDSDRQPLAGRPAMPPEPVIDEGVAFLVTSILEGVVERGTGARLRRDGLRDPVAGKSGTTNGRRDSWFVGYAPERVALVWVGYDDATPTKLSGSRGALPIWGRFMQQRRPSSGYSTYLPPSDVRSVTIDPATGGMATGRCPETTVEYYLSDQAPTEMCEIHGRKKRRWWRPWGRSRERN